MATANLRFFRGPFLLICVLAFTISAFPAGGAAHTIAGTVFDAGRIPLPDIDVELQDQYGRTVNNGRQKTGGGGRFQFTVGTQGRYTIKVYAFRYDYEDESMDIEVSAVSAVAGEGGSSYNNHDFYLRPKRGGLVDAELGVVFAQDVPSAAKKAYETAIRDLAAKRIADGFAGLNQALSIKADYFMALNRMGRELFMQGRFEESVPFLLKAGDVNPKSATAFYYLGSALFQLGKQYHSAATAALANAAAHAPSSPQVHYMYGRALKSEGKFAEAEKSLVRAKKLSNENVPEIHKELAQLYADNLKKYDAAADELEAYMKASKQRGPDQENTRKVIAGLRAKAKSNTSN
ncbi:MAG TPA: hypothetical protein PKD26_08095 [Pyrinomonadaceae bacterium]|nr:hypothetical protein [Pyrinomonadaceae bacterium]